MVVTGVVFGVLYPNTSHEKEHFTSGKPQLAVAEPPSRPLGARQEHAAERVLSKFVLTAVLRRHTAESYDLTAPSLRSGISRADWRGGNIPIPPFPAPYYVGGKLKLRYAHGDVARFEVLLLGKPHTDYEEQLYSMELRLLGPRGHRRWMVDYWWPEGGGISTPVHRSASSAAAVAASDGTTQLALAWIFIPLGILSLILVVPAALAVRSWRRGRRAEREYSSTRPLPPLGRTG